MHVRALRSAALGAAVLLVGGLSAQAKPQSFKIDAVHSSVIFKVKHMGVSWSYGRFNDISGQFVLDEQKPEDCKIDLTIDVASVDTGNADRDKHLKAPDFFNAEQFPDITFVSKKVTKAGADLYEVTGDMTLHGVTKSLTMKLAKTGEGTHEMMGHRVGFETAFSLKRGDYGMKEHTDALGDEVFVTISIEGAAN